MTIRHPHVISIPLLKRSYRREHTAFFVRVRGHYGSPWKHKMGVHLMSNFMIQAGYQEILPQKDFVGITTVDGMARRSTLCSTLSALPQ